MFYRTNIYGHVEFAITITTYLSKLNVQGDFEVQSKLFSMWTFTLFLLLIEKNYFPSCIVSKFFQINILLYQFENEGIYINPNLLLNLKVKFEIIQ
jgi:hypothetical protein